jgi:hypothetical protein
MEELMQNHADDAVAPRSKSDVEDNRRGGRGDQLGGRR